MLSIEEKVYLITAGTINNFAWSFCTFSQTRFYLKVSLQYVFSFFFLIHPITETWNMTET